MEGAHDETVAEMVAQVRCVEDLLLVSTSAGRQLAAHVESLPLKLPPRESEGRHVDPDPSGKGIYIDGRPITLKRLRRFCEHAGE